MEKSQNVGTKSAFMPFFFFLDFLKLHLTHVRALMQVF